MSTRSRVLLAAGFLAAALLRLAWLAAFVDNWDFRMYREFVEAAPRGAELYRLLYPYSPLWAFLLLGISRAAALAEIPFAKAVGGVLLGVDVATAFFLFLIARDRLGRSAERAAGAALLFFANPVSVFVTGFHLQWDNFAILCVVAAVWMFSADRARAAGSSAVLALSLLLKHIAFFHPLAFGMRARRRGFAILFLLPYAVFFTSFLPYWKDRRLIARTVFGYRSHSEDYGSSMLTKIPGTPDWLPTALLFVAVLFALLSLRHVKIERACLLLFLVVLLFAPGILEYYLVWPIALGSLFGGAGYAVFTFVVSSFFLGSPDGLGLPLEHLPGWHGIWWSILLWLMWEIRRTAKT